MPKSLSEKRNILSDLQTTAQSLKRHGSTPHASTSQHTDVPIPQIEQELGELATAELDILRASLHELNLPHEVIEQLMDKVTEPVSRQKEAMTCSFAKFCRTLSSASYSSPISLRSKYRSIQNTSRTTFMRFVDQVRETTIAEASKWVQEQERQPADFNTEFVPYLEQYFEYDAYPSAQHHALLASKSRMSSKQISTWFQNRRARARKEGLPVRRRMPGEPPLDIDILIPVQPTSGTRSQRTMSEPASEDGHSYSSEPSTPRCDPDPNPLSTADECSSEAYDVVYEPVGFDELSTLLDQRTHLPPPEWERQPSPRKAHTQDIDMDALIDRFALMRVWMAEQKTKRTSRRPTPSPCYLPPAVTVTLPAPLPALHKVRDCRRTSCSSKRPSSPKSSATTSCPSSPATLSRCLQGSLSRSRPPPFSPHVLSRWQPSTRTTSRFLFTPYPSLFVTRKLWPLRCAATEPLPFSVSVLSLVS
ncbi:hypothetical protein BKA70DRAFT_275567 [Coprinopsis sp. MPI-PUGE-AT-0042]|nr:hypothetical protein BKA70DRAFT_275567 [Coprinopsis sp. MPI-PUGE-AT-0042]